MVLDEPRLHEPALSHSPSPKLWGGIGGEKQRTQVLLSVKSSREYEPFCNSMTDCLAVHNIQAVQRPREGSLPYTGMVAAEPGLDYRTIDVEGFDGSAEVTVTDYSSLQCLISKRTDRLGELEEFLYEDRPSWCKVRWINVDGLNWQCIKLLAMTYNLHRLAIEDLLSVQRTKIDLYPDSNCPFYSRLTV